MHPRALASACIAHCVAKAAVTSSSAEKCTKARPRSLASACIAHCIVRAAKLPLCAESCSDASPRVLASANIAHCVANAVTSGPWVEKCHDAETGEQMCMKATQVLIQSGEDASLDSSMSKFRQNRTQGETNPRVLASACIAHCLANAATAFSSAGGGLPARYLRGVHPLQPSVNNCPEPSPVLHAPACIAPGPVAERHQTLGIEECPAVIPGARVPAPLAGCVDAVATAQAPCSSPEECPVPPAPSVASTIVSAGFADCLGGGSKAREVAAGCKDACSEVSSNTTSLACIQPGVTSKEEASRPGSAALPGSAGGLLLCGPSSLDVTAPSRPPSAIVTSARCSSIEGPLPGTRPVEEQLVGEVQAVPRQEQHSGVEAWSGGTAGRPASRNTGPQSCNLQGGQPRGLLHGDKVLGPRPSSADSASDFEVAVGTRCSMLPDEYPGGLPLRGPMQGSRPASAASVGDFASQCSEARPCSGGGLGRRWSPSRPASRGASAKFSPLPEDGPCGVLSTGPALGPRPVSATSDDFASQCSEVDLFSGWGLERHHSISRPASRNTGTRFSPLPEDEPFGLVPRDPVQGPRPASAASIGDLASQCSDVYSFSGEFLGRRCSASRPVSGNAVARFSALPEDEPCGMLPGPVPVPAFSIAGASSQCSEVTLFGVVALERHSSTSRPASRNAGMQFSLLAEEAPVDLLPVDSAQGPRPASVASFGERSEAEVSIWPHLERQVPMTPTPSVAVGRSASRCSSLTRGSPPAHLEATLMALDRADSRSSEAARVGSPRASGSVPADAGCATSTTAKASELSEVHEDAKFSPQAVSGRTGGTRRTPSVASLGRSPSALSEASPVIWQTAGNNSGRAMNSCTANSAQMDAPCGPNAAADHRAPAADPKRAEWRPLRLGYHVSCNIDALGELSLQRATGPLLVDLEAPAAAAGLPHAWAVGDDEHTCKSPGVDFSPRSRSTLSRVPQPPGAPRSDITPRSRSPSGTGPCPRDLATGPPVVEPMCSIAADAPSEASARLAEDPDCCRPVGGSDCAPQSCGTRPAAVATQAFLQRADPADGLDAAHELAISPFLRDRSESIARHPRDANAEVCSDPVESFSSTPRGSSGGLERFDPSISYLDASLHEAFLESGEDWYEDFAAKVLVPSKAGTSDSEASKVMAAAAQWHGSLEADWDLPRVSVTDSLKLSSLEQADWGMPKDSARTDSFKLSLTEQGSCDAGVHAEPSLSSGGLSVASAVDARSSCEHGECVEVGLCVASAMGAQEVFSHGRRHSCPCAPEPPLGVTLPSSGAASWTVQLQDDGCVSVESRGGWLGLEVAESSVACAGHGPSVPDSWAGGGCLMVTKVWRAGHLARWNEAYPQYVVYPGDAIMEVNGERQAVAMMRQLNEDRVNLRVVRCSSADGRGEAAGTLFSRACR